MSHTIDYHKSLITDNRLKQGVSIVVKKTVITLLSGVCLLYAFDSTKVNTVVQQDTKDSVKAATTGITEAGQGISSEHPGTVQKADTAQTVKIQASGEQKESIPAQIAAPAQSPDISRAVQIPGGVLYGVFSKDDGPFLLTGSIIVPSGQKLEFGPGSVIYVGGKYSTITVYGQLVAQGTEKEPVIFQSANPKPNPWDWDRIYCRSRKLSIFKYCTIRHSNYGISIENGSATIDNCTFERNSLHGVVVKNSDVTILKSVFTRGHVLALLCMEGASVQAESLTVSNNISGIACENRSSFQMSYGIVQGNSNGIAVKKDASVTILAADITRNRIGIVSEVEIPMKMREMVYHNTVDLKLATARELESLLKPPAEITAIALRKEKSEVQTSSNFKAGFSALNAPREATASFIGNVSTGIRYFHPTSNPNPKDGIVYPQIKYPGEYTDAWYAKFQPEFVVFAQGKKGLIDVNLNTDIYLNDWVDNQLRTRANLFTLAINYGTYSVAMGDFYENISEISMSGRKFRGLKLFGDAWNMGRGVKRIEFKLAAGETEIKKDKGEHELDMIGDTVETGFSVRQQLTYLANVLVRAAPNVSIGARGIISHDQDARPILSEAVSDTAAPKPLSGQTGSIDANVALLDGKMNIALEIGMGARDTVDSARYGNIAWYNPQMGKAISRVFGVIRPDSDNYAILTDITGMVNGFDLKGTFMEIAKNYFSAGNPYLEPDRRVVSVTGEKQFSEILSAQAGYDFERTSVSKDFAVDREAPTNNNTFTASGEYSFGENRPGIGADYELMVITNKQAGTIELITINPVTQKPETTSQEADYTYKEADNTGGVEVKQRFVNGIDYSVKYMLRNINDFADYPEDQTGSYSETGKDTWEHNIQARVGFSIKKYVQNKTTVKIKFKNDYAGTSALESGRQVDFKVGDDIRVGIIPRKLTLTMKGEYRRKTDNKDSDLSGVFTPTLTTEKNIEASLKYTITSKLSAILSGKYEDHYDESPSSTENYSAGIGSLHVMLLF